jgi:thiol-disulfide isomerase/thioredoxin
MPPQKPDEAEKKPKAKINRKSILIVSIIIAASIIGFLVYSSQNSSSNMSSLIGQPVSSDIYNSLSNVSYSTLSSIGRGSTTSPLQISGPTLSSDNKPLIVYLGAEYCPYCAAERWSMIVALSKFGNFTNLSYMESSPTDVYSNTPTFSFYGATYTSPYISFQSVELQDRLSNPLQTPTPDQEALAKTYNPQGGIPFVDIANQYMVSGSQYQVSLLSGMNWEQISSQLDNPNSNVAQGIDGAADTLISKICKVTNDTPSNVCSQSFANLS